MSCMIYTFSKCHSLIYPCNFWNIFLITSTYQKLHFLLLESRSGISNFTFARVVFFFFCFSLSIRSLTKVQTENTSERSKVCSQTDFAFELSVKTRPELCEGRMSHTGGSLSRLDRHRLTAATLTEKQAHRCPQRPAGDTESGQDSGSSSPHLTLRTEAQQRGGKEKLHWICLKYAEVREGTSALHLMDESGFPAEDIVYSVMSCI